MNITVDYTTRKMIVLNQIRGFNEEHLIDDMIFTLPSQLSGFNIAIVFAQGDETPIGATTLQMSWISGDLTYVVPAQLTQYNHIKFQILAAHPTTGQIWKSVIGHIYFEQPLSYIGDIPFSELSPYPDWVKAIEDAFAARDAALLAAETANEAADNANQSIVNVDNAILNIYQMIEAGELDGHSAYQVWLDLGNTGTEQDFINALRGASAYQVWIDEGNIGTIDDFFNFLSGAEVIISDSAPLDVKVGTIWWDSINGGFYVWYQDSDGLQWVEAPIGQTGLGLPPGGNPGDILMKKTYDEWDYEWQTRYEIIKEFLKYKTLTSVSNTYILDVSQSPVQNFKVNISDSNPKTFSLLNIPSEDCEIFIRLKCDYAVAVTWFSGISWLGNYAPSFSQGKTYRLGFWTENGGLTWHGVNVGGW